MTPPRTQAAALPPQPPTREQFGANAGSVFAQPVPLTRAQIATDLATLRASGGTLVRQDAYWEASEPQPPSSGGQRYDWRFDDEIASALAVQGLRWLPIIDYAPVWAQASVAVGGAHPPPRDPAAYAAYAAAFAARYGPGGAFWRAHSNLPAVPVDALELWNEPDNPTFWYPAPDLRSYAVLFSAAQRAIAAVAPGMKVIPGGLDHPQSSLPILVAALRALNARIDGATIHPYAPTPSGVLGQVRTARALLRKLRLGDVPLYVTEFGWTTSPPGALDYAPAALRPGYIEQTLAALGRSGCRVAAVTVFAWVSTEHNPASYAEWFGLSSSPADRAAFAAGLRAAATPRPGRRIC